MLKYCQIISRKLTLPSICPLCSQYHNDPDTICNFCSNFFSKIQSKCYKCALPLVTNHSQELCGRCLSNEVHFDKVLVNYIYEEPLKSLIQQFKYKNAIYLKNFLVKLMLDNPEIQSLKTQCLMPIPIHTAKHKERGFNQSALLAFALAKELKLNVASKYCKKITNTFPQAHLKLKDRVKNLKNSFAVKKIPYNNVTLIDDLITTGTTANEIARKLKANGVETVNVWCIARAI